MREARSLEWPDSNRRGGRLRRGRGGRCGNSNAGAGPAFSSRYAVTNSVLERAAQALQRLQLGDGLGELGLGFGHFQSVGTVGQRAFGVFLGLLR